MLALKKLEGRRLKVELKSVSKMLRALAEDPMEADPKQLGSAAVAFLRYREQVSWSTGHQQLGGYYLVLCSWLLVRLQPTCFCLHVSNQVHCHVLETLLKSSADTQSIVLPPGVGA